MVREDVCGLKSLKLDLKRVMHPSLCGSGGKAEAASAKVLRQCERLSQSREKPELPVLARLGWCHADDSAWFG